MTVRVNCNQKKYLINKAPKTTISAHFFRKSQFGKEKLKEKAKEKYISSRLNRSYKRCKPIPTAGDGRKNFTSSEGERRPMIGNSRWFFLFIAFY
jgi:hypothetical protein